jgi:hypothetical protein
VTGSVDSADLVISVAAGPGMLRVCDEQTKSGWVILRLMIISWCAAAPARATSSTAEQLSATAPSVLTQRYKGPCSNAPLLDIARE